jgi:hypothetical protein
MVLTPINLDAPKSLGGDSLAGQEAVHIYFAWSRALRASSFERIHDGLMMYDFRDQWTTSQRAELGASE